ncbi:protein ANTAGONIST OF LIKE HETEROCHROMATIN PROTEIN 1-like [Acropora millepora]|uniref:protein ANTAGONIST OF LIKE HETEROCHROMATIN PROTEIN 1-like n=1 Tax=Acropora millepora TaxID=45264 RepID=UPI001CF413C9|nr:protein ANTAGONIST OF LIKE HETEROCHROMATIN PROTEIN 1-like [Acropora millepora]
MADDESRIRQSRSFYLISMLNRIRRRRRLLQTTVMNPVSRLRRILSICILLLLALIQRDDVVQPIRSCRRLFRNSGWWDTVWNNYSEARFKKTFRVTRGTFLYILSRIRHQLERQTVTEDPIFPELRLAICLYRLGRGDYFYTIAEMTGLGVSTVCTVVREVSQAIIDCMWEDSISKHVPRSEAEFKKKIIDMDELWQFPYCWAGIDGCHIPMKCPPGGLQSSKEYRNFKNFYSTVVMALVDSQYRFVGASCGFPGNWHDAIILKSTDLWSRIEEGRCIPNIGQSMDGVTVPPLIVGDSAFSLCTWLMKPYTNAVLTPQQRNFNYRLSRARMVTEGAYGQLKGRWRVLLRKCESARDQVRTTTLACLILHNVCIDRGDAIPKKLDLTLDPNTQARRPREEVRKLLQMTTCSTVKDTSSEAQKVRNALCKKLWLENNTGKVS